MAEGGGQHPERKENFPKGWDYSGSIRQPKKHLEIYPWCTFEKKVDVETKRLDTWIREQGIEYIDFIWADVQGAEVDLIKGAGETLARTRYFYTEYSNKELYRGQINLRGLLNLLPNFEVLYRYDNDVLLRNTELF